MPTMNRLLILTFSLMLALPLDVQAVDVTPDILVGKWKFTHMILDGQRNLKVNRLMEFRPDGKVVNYDNTGAEQSIATYRITDDAIIYSDKQGKQNWVIKKFDGSILHVNHKGADMFFEKTS